jgi:hypothetical protein
MPAPEVETKELGQFFESLRHTWEVTRDGAKIAEFYQTPCLALRGNGAFVCFQTRADIASFFQAAIDGFYSQGYVRWLMRDFSAQLLGKRGALVTLTWQCFGDQSDTPKEIHQSYNLVLIERTWKIVLSTMHLAE